MAGRVTDAERAKLRQLHAAGRTRNEIAKELGRAAATVTQLATDMGLSFDRSETKAAVAAKMEDAKARRAQLALDLLSDAQRLRVQLFEQAHVYAFGGKDNTFAEAYVTQPSFRDQRDIIGAASMAVTAALRLDQHDTANADTAKSVLGALAAGLGVAYAELQAADDAD